MHAGNKPTPPDGPWAAAIDRALAGPIRALWDGALGRTVRCVPRRRTVIAATPCGVMFGKWHLGRPAEAAAEWRWLHVLPLLGIAAARPLAWLGGRSRSLVVTTALPGRSLDAWAADAAREGWLADWSGYVRREVAPLVQRLHGHGLVHRDLNFCHLFAVAPRAGGPPGLIDCERMFRPRWRRRRWWIKDLATLWASAPANLSPLAALRFLRAYLGEPLARHRRLLRRVVGKAARIRSHAPRFG